MLKKGDGVFATGTEKITNLGGAGALVRLHIADDLLNRLLQVITEINNFFIDLIELTQLQQRLV